MKVSEAINELRKEKKRKFNQTIDLIINLKDLDLRKNQINFFVTLPHPGEKKICAFLKSKSKLVDTITEAEMLTKFKEQKEIKKLAKKYDMFMANASLMPQIATKFGRILGPLGKMPNPQAGIIPNENEETIKAMLEKMKKMIRVKTKEPSIKIAIGKEDSQEKDIEEDIHTILEALQSRLPKGKENIKNVLIKFTMTKPIKIEW